MMQINTYLQKQYKGRYVEYLQEFLFSLDKEYDWRMFVFAIKQRRKTAKEKVFFVFSCASISTLIVAKVHLTKKLNSYNTIVQMGMDGTFQIDGNMFLIETVYSKEVMIDDDTFDSLSEHLLFLY